MQNGDESKRNVKIKAIVDKKRKREQKAKKKYSQTVNKE